MIFDSTDFDGLHSVLAGDAAHERPQSLTQDWRDEFAPFLCAENQMNRIAHVRHAGIQPSLRDSINPNSSPAVNCRAIFVSPSGRSTGIWTPECPNSSAGGPRPQHIARSRWSGAFLSLSADNAAADRAGPGRGQRRLIMARINRGL